MPPAPLHVVAGALVDASGRVLIAERPAGKSHAGRWEFPGGKLKDGEAARDGLARELAEELGIELLRATPLLTVTHEYPGAAQPTRIECWHVDFWRGQPSGLDGQRLRWCTPAELAEADILEADRAIVTALLLPRLMIRIADRALAGRSQPRLRAGDRVGWLLDAAATGRGAASQGHRPGDALFLVDPESPPASGVGAVYTAPARCRPARERTAPSGCLAADGAEARAALLAGADFLLVARRRLPASALAAIAAVGLPWYLNMAEAGERDAPLPTGRLWWREAGAASAEAAT